MNLERFLAQHRLPNSFLGIVDDYYAPLGEWLLARIKGRDSGAPVLGINGAQGTGKTTLSRFLGEFLRCHYGLEVAELSLDDIYLTRVQRDELARRVHPLLATRGVPGTHDVDLGKQLIKNLRGLRTNESMPLPRFDKAADERGPASTWPVVFGPVDLIILEGWCVGSTPLPEDRLEGPINRLEAEEDSDCVWRRYANEQLATTYAGLFGMLDFLVFLEAPNFEAIHRWRLEQERKLAASLVGGGAHTMDEASLARFLQFYERITRHNLATMPALADVILTLAEDHSVVRASYAH